MTASPPLPAPNFPEVYLTGISRSQYKKVEVKDKNADSVQQNKVTAAILAGVTMIATTDSSVNKILAHAHTRERAERTQRNH